MKKKTVSVEVIKTAHQLGSKMIDLADQEEDDHAFVALLRLGNNLLRVGDPWGFELTELTDEDRQLIAKVNKKTV